MERTRQVSRFIGHNLPSSFAVSLPMANVAFVVGLLRVEIRIPAVHMLGKLNTMHVREKHNVSNKYLQISTTHRYFIQMDSTKANPIKLKYSLCSKI
jgi:hypothetical protein